MNDTAEIQEKSIGGGGLTGAPGSRSFSEGAGALLGLSTYHISPVEMAVIRKVRQSSAIIYNGASLLKVIGGSKRVWDNKPGIRGKAGFSFASRRRLMRVVAKIPRKLLPVFITLTYPGEFSKDPERWKRDLDSFGKSLIRKNQACFCIWKLELQVRGAPHYHLLVWGIKNGTDLREWVSNSWFRVVGSGDLRHLVAGTRCEDIRSQRGAFSYISKYSTKKDNNDYEGIGRAWGIIGRGNYENKIVRPVVVEISAIDADRLLKDMALMIGASEHEFDALTVLCDAEFWYLSIDCFHERGRRFSIGSSSLVV